ncbi:RNA-directed DNA polymerase, eukaryota [Tanacetum coccineum]
MGTICTFPEMFPHRDDTCTKDRLVNNLCTIWVGRFKLHANLARFQRAPSNKEQKPGLHKGAVHWNGVNSSRPASSGNFGGAKSFVNVVTNVNDKSKSDSPLSDSPATVLDDSCFANHDFEKCVMGEVKLFSSINNLRVILANEGFHNIRIAYLGGLWVMIELPSANSKSKLLKHVGVMSWFKSLSNAQPDFQTRDRIVWVDIEGVPMHVWSRNTFHKIGSRWGEVLDLEESKEDFFARKRICIKTKQEDNILEKIKITVKGKIFVIRAKELFVWSPSFTEVDEKDCNKDDELDNESGEILSAPLEQNLEDESDNEAVSDTEFGENADESGNVNSSCHKEPSQDPFNIYDLLHKKTKEAAADGMSSSIPFPPGFTPDKMSPIPESQKLQEEDKSASCSSRIAGNIQKIDEQISSRSNGNGCHINTGGSILSILEEMIKVGQTMGFNMEGLGSKDKHNWIKELCTKNKISFLSVQETKSNNISDMVIKNIWGNSIFEATVSEAIGNSGGLLCVWDPKAFHKDHQIISDNFIALYGSWTSKHIKMLLISVYAPQSASLKRSLWDYLTSIINRWNGECIVMGDFNEVRRKEDRWGSVFNVYGARAFNQFIASAGLVEIHLEGYNFTWTHPSASKMSKLDRFLVSDGFLSIFPHVSAVCLDRHLSDHRPILLREVIIDYGAIPFRFFHSWFEFQGFDLMVTQTWNDTTLTDSNGMIRFKKKLQILKKEMRIWIADRKKA